MVRHHGYRNKTRKRFKKNIRTRGLPGLSKFMIEYTVGQKIDILGDPSFQKRGLPHRHFIGKTGDIIGQRGRCYEVHVMDGDKAKTLFIGKEHIRLNRDWLMHNQDSA